MTGRSRRRSSGTGQSLAEFALLLPTMYLIFAGGVDLARAYAASVEVTDGAREAALYASHHPGYSTSDLQSVLVGSVGQTPSLLRCNNPMVVAGNVTNAPAANAYEQPISATCSLPMLIGAVPFIPSTIVLRTSVTAYVCPVASPPNPC